MPQAEPSTNTLPQYMPQRNCFVRISRSWHASGTLLVTSAQSSWALTTSLVNRLAVASGYDYRVLAAGLYLVTDRCVDGNSTPQVFTTKPLPRQMYKTASAKVRFQGWHDDNLTGTTFMLVELASTCQLS